MRRRRSTSTNPTNRVTRPPDDSGQQRAIVVLFADIIGCSEVSNYMRLEEYNRFLNEFHEIFRKVVEEHRDTWLQVHERQYLKVSVRGDEGCAMLFVPRSKSLAADVDTMLCMALDLKRRWLLSDVNKQRILEVGLLPTELAIGIHVGRAFINCLAEPQDGCIYRPEGYTINLTKRVETESRDGRFSKVFVSAPARGELYLLSDEATYTFSAPHDIRPRGISTHIRVFEVKHHFLSTDWADLRGPVPRTRASVPQPSEDDVRIVEQAHRENPTNLWLAEEYIMLKMAYEYERLQGADESDPRKYADAYGPALEVARRFATGDQRDGGILSICGFILGESSQYGAEQQFYREAIAIDPHYAEAHWYLGYSLSSELNAQLEKEGRKPKDMSSLRGDKKRLASDAIASFKQAVYLNGTQPWMRFDLACELARWGYRRDAVDELCTAALANEDVIDYIADEDYLDSIKAERQVKTLLEKSEK